MAKKSVTAKHKDLGIFYTDPAIADFIYSIVNVWKNDEDNKTKRWLKNVDKFGKPVVHYPSVIDPAVGEGVFLKEALEQGFTDIHHIFGLDLDADAVEKWKQIHLLKAFGGNEKDLEAHFFHQNGLDKIKWDQHATKYFSHLKKDDIKNQQFNLVIGNPPYGGTGLDIDEEHEDFIDYLRDYEILPEDIKKELGDKTINQTDIFGDHNVVKGKTDKASKRLKSFPIEILFIERFLKLAKPGGWVVIVLPEGIFANSNAHYVREYISDKAKVEAIVSLPRDAFKSVGTTAKTNILFLRKYGPVYKRAKDYKVFLAISSNIMQDSFLNITNKYIEYYGGVMTKNITTISDDSGKEQIMVRTDKKLSDFMNEKPTSRWDPGYWHPKNDITSIYPNLQFELMGKYVDSITYGVITTGENRKFSLKGHKYISSTTVLDLGIDHKLNPLYIADSDKRNSKTKIPTFGDIIFNRNGVGTLGRQCVFTLEDHYVISDDTDLIKIKGKSSFYISAILKSSIGQLQIDQRKRGVSGQIKISFEDIKSIKIPIFDEQTYNNIVSEYEYATKLFNKYLNKGDKKILNDAKNHQLLSLNIIERALSEQQA